MPVLPFEMQYQQETYWCWSAVATSTSHYYDNTSTWTQCLLANEFFAPPDCCSDGSSSGCNKVYNLQEPLKATGSYVNHQYGLVTFNVLRQQIENKKPLGARIQRSVGGHFVVLNGYDDSDGEWVFVRDPYDGNHYMTYDEFRIDYLGDGDWTHSYWTTG